MQHVFQAVAEQLDNQLPWNSLCSKIEASKKS